MTLSMTNQIDRCFHVIALNGYPAFHRFIHFSDRTPEVVNGGYFAAHIFDRSNGCCPGRPKGCDASVDPLARETDMS